jgi:uncharacterized protein involved in exopolysaccharide biosynthesis
LRERLGDEEEKYQALEKKIAYEHEQAASDATQELIAVRIKEELDKHSKATTRTIAELQQKHATVIQQLQADKLALETARREDQHVRAQQNIQTLEAMSKKFEQQQTVRYRASVHPSYYQ